MDDPTPHPRVMIGVLTLAELQHLKQAQEIANLASACHVAERCAPTRVDGVTWLDTRPMLDPRECSGSSIDLAATYLHYLEFAGIATRHPDQRHLVRLKMPAPLAAAAQDGA